jgi:FSR family fosmidomycin resistance protein-like MFS transporter
VLLTVAVWWALVGYLAASMAPGYWSFLVLLAIGGAGSAAWHPLATGTMIQYMPRRRAQMLGIHLTGGVLAEVITPLSVGFLLNVLEWRTVLQIAVGPAVVMGIAMLFMGRWAQGSTEPSITRADLRFMFDVWRRPAGLGMLGLGVAYNMSLTALLAMTPLFLLDYRGYSTVWTGVIFATMLLGGAIAAPIMGRVSDRSGRKRVIAISCLVSSGGALLIAFAPEPALMVLGAVTAASLMTGMRPALLAASVEMVGRRETTSLGMIYAVTDGLGAMGALLAGLAGGADLRYAFVFSAVLAILAAAMAVGHPFRVAAPAAESVVGGGAGRGRD